MYYIIEVFFLDLFEFLELIIISSRNSFVLMADKKIIIIIIIITYKFKLYITI